MTKDHFYHNGGSIENRHAVVEALVFNFDIHEKMEIRTAKQLELFAEAVQVSKEAGYVNAGDRVVIVAGVPLGKVGSTNMIRVVDVK
jgi:pyruvate kinase